MEKIKHTPGPWQAKGFRVEVSNFIVAKTGNTYSNKDGHLLERQANARLIAKAPEMYKELCKVKTELAYFCDCGQVSSPDLIRARLGAVVQILNAID